MNYSIIPDEIIFDEWDGAELERHQKMAIGNCQCIVEPLDDNQVKIVSLLSSNPADFLDPRYQPGAIVKFTPEIG